MTSILVPLISRPALKGAASELVSLFYASQTDDLQAVIKLGQFLKVLSLDESNNVNDLVRLLYLMRQSEVADFVRDFQQWRPGNSVCELERLYHNAVQGDLNAFCNLVGVADHAQSKLETLKELGLACPEALTFVTELLQLDPR